MKRTVHGWSGIVLLATTVGVVPGAAAQQVAPAPAAPPVAPAPAAPSQQQSVDLESAGTPPSSEGGQPETALSDLPYYTPLPAEKAPARPPPPSRPMTLSLGLRSYVLPDVAGGGMDNSLQARLGSAFVAGGISYLASSGLFGLPGELPHFAGFRIATMGKGLLAILSPSFHAELLFLGGQGTNVFLNAGGSATGVTYTSCHGPLPWFAQLSGPSLTGWVPASAAGAGFGQQGVQAFTSWGFSLETGILLF